MTNMFRGRTMAIATKHGKEKVIAPVFERELGIHFEVPVNFDTDLLGTFTGEVERTMDPLTTARKKCLLAMEATGLDMAVASEGSFGPHPTIPFLPADDEWLFFIDKLNGIEVYGRHLSTTTNFSATQIKSFNELLEFAKKSGFPQHGIILRPGEHESADIMKDILNYEDLEKGYELLMDRYSKLYAETDMRAMHNPTRMEIIKEAAEKLVAKISNCCPQCQTPGFGITDAITGLPCGYCGSATRSILSYVYKCTKCSYSMLENYPHKKKVEEPGFCDLCNP